MGRGWRRAFCTTIPRDREVTLGETIKQSPSPRSSAKLGFLSSSSSSGGGSNPSTPRLQSQFNSSANGATPNLLRCRTTTAQAFQVPPSVATADNPQLQRNAATPKPTTSAKSPRRVSLNSSSPRSPLKFSIFKNSLRLSKNNCGVCVQSVKSGKGTAIFTAECGHAFHFPCIAAHVRGHRSLACPVCAAPWRDVPLLSAHQRRSIFPKSEAEEEKKRDNIAPGDLKIKPVDSRAYDDDEPLLSAASCGRFVPIPEADDEREDDEIEEFQGFFVDPKPRPKWRVGNSRNVEVKLLPESALISAGRGLETYAVALRVKAPPPPQRLNTTSSLLDPSRRAPIDLVTVLDVSGSMTGAKLQMLKRAMRLVVSSLGSVDRLSIIAFAATPKRLLPLKRMTAQGQRLARGIIDGLGCGAQRGTSVADALRKATKVLEDRRERNPVATVILLSDGHGDRVTENSAHQRRGSADLPATRFAHIEIPVHEFGFGADPAEDAFAKCVGGLLSVVARDLRIQLVFGSGSAPAEISAVYSCNGRPTVLGSGFGSVRLGDLYAEEERELLVELRVPATGGGSHHVMTVRCSYKDPSSQELVYGSDQMLVVPRLGPTRSSPSPTSTKIARLRSLFITARAVAESRRLVEYNELSSANQLLSSARALLVQSSSGAAAPAWVEEYVRCLEAELGEVRWRSQVLEEQRKMMMKIQRRGLMNHERETSGFVVDENGEPLTPTSAWREAERLAKVAMMKKSMNRVSDLHGFENARF